MRDLHHQQKDSPETVELSERALGPPNLKRRRSSPSRPAPAMPKGLRDCSERLSEARLLMGLLGFYGPPKGAFWGFMGLLFGASDF